MQSWFRIPFIFFFIAACIGLLLRWHFVSPMDWLQFPYWLHAHSHIMFLGWIFNTLFLAYVSNYSLSKRRYGTLFIIIQVLLGGMLISFPLQGYGVVSIILSFSHTVLVGVFCWWIFRDFRKIEKSTSIWFAKMSLILFLLSALGPFTLGPLVANGLGQTKWYYFSIYYYLHFQYNGVFIFGVLSLFFHFLEERKVQFNVSTARKSGLLLMIAIFPTYFLSTLWAKPGFVFNIIGCMGAFIQLLSLYYFIKIISVVKFSKMHRATKTLVMLAFLAFILKSVLQLISAHPQIAKLAFEVRPFTIAYLHLVMIGVVTLFLLAWCVEKKVVVLKFSFPVTLIIIGFLGSELTMILGSIPFTSTLFVIQSSVLLFTFSLLLTVGIGFFLYYLLLPSDARRAIDQAMR